MEIKYQVPLIKYPSIKPKAKKKIPKPVDTFAFSHEDRVLKQKAFDLLRQIEKLTQERKEVVEAMKKREMLRNKGKLRQVRLYALELEEGCWYIGMSYDPVRRLVRHQNGKGAQWTKLHKPIRIHEVRETYEYIQDNAAKLEDDMTIEYAMKYGKHKVRGGGYCQAKPYWPDVVLQNE